MKILTIPSKGSNSGSIYDIADSHVDREITFRKGCIFAVVPASYYGAHYTTHKSASAAAKASISTEFENKIIDYFGIEYEVIQTYDGFDLISTRRKAS